MNPIHLIDEFLRRAATDDCLSAQHISLWMAIFQLWHTAGAQHPIRATRLSLMQMGKIGSKVTYHRCIQDLNHLGYIYYQASNHPIEGSVIDLFQTPLSEASTRSGKETSTKSDTSEPMKIKTKENSLRNINTGYNPIDTPPKFCSEPELEETRTQSGTSKKSSVYNDITDINNIKNIEEVVPQVRQVPQKGQLRPPELPRIVAFFSAQNLPEIEAQKFFNYYQSNGWKVGKNPMKNWEAAARNWILNREQYATISKPVTPQPANLNASTSKNYSEPL